MWKCEKTHNFRFYPRSFNWFEAYVNICQTSSSLQHYTSNLQFKFYFRALTCPLEAPRPAKPLTDTRLVVPARLASTRPVVPTRLVDYQELTMVETLIVVPLHPASTLAGVPWRPALILVVLTRLGSAQGHPQA